MKFRLGAWLIALAPLLLCAAGITPTNYDAHLTPVFDFTRADFVLDDARVPPPAGADWRPVRLPDNWYRTHPGITGIGWYRIGFDLPPGPYFLQTFYLPRGNAESTGVFLNGKRVTGFQVQGDSRGLTWDEPIRSAIAPALLQPGRNWMFVRVEAVAGLHQGLTRVVLGPSFQVLPRYFEQYTLQVDLLRVFGGAALLAGVMAAGFWLRDRRDAVMFWFGITAWAWTFMALPWFQQRFGAWGLAGDLMIFPLHFAYVAPLIVLCLRITSTRAVWLEAPLWVFTLCGAAAMPLATRVWRGSIVTGWSAVYLIAMTALAGWLASRLLLRREPTPRILTAAVVLAVAGSGYDFSRWMAWIDFDTIPLQQFHVPLVLLAAGATMLRRHFAAIDAVAAARAGLELRVEEKTREIAANFERLRHAEQETALARERTRIMADIHDGVGASLLNLIAAARSGRIEPAQIEHRAQQAILELRMAIDSLEPVDRDLGVVLGNVRHRLREAIDESGVEFHWVLGELPPLDYLSPKAVLTIQRIVLEAISNALRHAHARSLTVRTVVEAAAGRLLIEVADDGTGFDPATARRGRGLDSLANRARSIGAAVTIAASGAGTTVTLTLPLGASAAERAPEALQGFATKTQGRQEKLNRSGRRHAGPHHSGS